MKYITKLIIVVALGVLSSCSQQIRDEIAAGAKRGRNRGVEASRRNQVSPAAFSHQQPAFVPINTDFINRQPVLAPPPSYRSNSQAPRSYDIYDSTGTRHLGTLKQKNTGIMPVGGWR